MENTNENKAPNEINESLKESALKSIEPIIDNFYNIEVKDEEGNVIVPDKTKSVKIEIGSTLIDIVSQLFNSLLIEYTKKNNIEITEGYKLVSDGINKILNIQKDNKESVDNVNKLNIDLFTICYLKIFIETWFHEMMENNNITKVSKEEYYRDAREMILNSKLFKQL